MSNLHTPKNCTGCLHIYASEGNTNKSLVVAPKGNEAKQEDMMF